MLILKHEDLQAHGFNEAGLIQAIADYQDALEAHKYTEEEPAPLAAPLVAFIVKGHGGLFELSDEPPVQADPVGDPELQAYLDELKALDRYLPRAIEDLIAVGDLPMPSSFAQTRMERKQELRELIAEKLATPSDA